MEIQLDQRHHQTPSYSELNRRLSNKRWTVDQLKSTEKPTLPATYENVPDIPLTHPRRLPPLEPDQSAAPQDAPQRAPFSHTQPLPLSTLPEQHLSEPIKLKLLLNPKPDDSTSASSCQHDGKGTGSSQTTPLTATSSQPSVSKKENLLSISYISPPSQSPTTASPKSRLYANSHQHNGKETNSPRTILMAATASLPSPSTRKNSLTAYITSPPLYHTSPPLALQATSTSEPQSVSTLFISGEKGFNAPTSVASGQGHYQTMTMKTEEGTIQVPVDVKAGSKISDEKRKRNASASSRFRKRRKVKEQETSNIISGLEAQIRELTKEKDFYQHGCETLQGVILQNNISMPPQPPSPRCRRQASLGVRLYQDNGASAPQQSKKRRTNAYAPSQAMLPMPSHIHTTTMPSKHISTTTTDASFSAMPSLSQPLNAMAPHYINPQQRFL